VRLTRQRRRLLRAAAAVFARHGYADATAEAIAREAGMSKATFYEHFDNKEGCILGLFDDAAGFVQRGMVEIADAAGDDPVERVRAAVRAFLTMLDTNHDEAQTLLVEIIGAGPAAARRRDQILAAFADVLVAANDRAVRRGVGRRLASPHDAYALVGAIFELASRHMRLGVPADARELEPVIDRLILGVLGSGPEPPG